MLCPNWGYRLAHNNLSSAGIVELARGLAATTSLLELDLTYVPVDDEGAAALADAVAEHASLRVLKLYKCQIGDDGVRELMATLGDSNRTVTTLDLGANRFGSDAVASIAHAVSANTVEELGLVGNDLRGSDAEVIAAALVDNTALRRLYIYGNFDIILDQIAHISPAPHHLARAVRHAPLRDHAARMLTVAWNPML